MPVVFVTKNTTYGSWLCCGSWPYFYSWSCCGSWPCCSLSWTKSILRQQGGFGAETWSQFSSSVAEITYIIQWGGQISITHHKYIITRDTRCTKQQSVNEVIWGLWISLARYENQISHHSFEALKIVLMHYTPRVAPGFWSLGLELNTPITLSIIRFWNVLQTKSELWVSVKVYPTKTMLPGEYISLTWGVLVFYLKILIGHPWNQSWGGFSSAEATSEVAQEVGKGERESDNLEEPSSIFL